MISIHEWGHADDHRPWIITDPQPAEALDTLLKLDGPLEIERALQMGVLLAGALETAHAAGIIHGDLSPARVVVGPHGEPLMTETGLARFAVFPGLGALNNPVRYHASPEVLEGTDLSPATDVYSRHHGLRAGRGPGPAGEAGRRHRQQRLAAAASAADGAAAHRAPGPPARAPGGAARPAGPGSPQAAPAGDRGGLAAPGRAAAPASPSPSRSSSTSTTSSTTGPGGPAATRPRPRRAGRPKPPPRPVGHLVRPHRHRGHGRPGSLYSRCSGRPGCRGSSLEPAPDPPISRPARRCSRRPEAEARARH